MIQDLTEAIDQSMDQADQPAPTPVLLDYTGRAGRPKIIINPELLAAGMSVSGPTPMGHLLNVSSRTVRRRALEAGLVEAGDPVYQEHTNNDGEIERVYTSSTGPQTTMSDDELDSMMHHFLQTFPSMGRRMIDGYFISHGHRVPRARVDASYSRVHGPSSSSFGARRIHRRVYSVTAFNSLWHHDGQHGIYITLHLMVTITDNSSTHRLDPVEDCSSRIY